MKSNRETTLLVKTGNAYRFNKFVLICLFVLSLFPGGWSGTGVYGQAEVRNVTQPIPVITNGGNTAPVRALVFAPPAGGQLLSAGLDKTINVWNLTVSPPSLSQTIRPRIWRGYAGGIYTIALAPRPEADGQRLLA